MKPLKECLLYGIVDTGYVPSERLAAMTRSLLQGGADIIQLRAKKSPPEEILSLGRELAPICRSAGVPFVLNDHPELVADCVADGAHIGQEDMSVAEARRLAGPRALIGKSTHSLEQALETAAERPDYLGFGPLFATPTKPNYTPVGTNLIREVHTRIGLPIFCIGGIKHSNLSDVLEAGAMRVVIVSDLLTAEDPIAQTARCRALIVAHAA